MIECLPIHTQRMKEALDFYGSVREMAKAESLSPRVIESTAHAYRHKFNTKTYEKVEVFMERWTPRDCPECKQTKPHIHFYLKKVGTFGRNYICLECHEKKETPCKDHN